MQLIKRLNDWGERTFWWRGFARKWVEETFLSSEYIRNLARTNPPAVASMVIGGLVILIFVLLYITDCILTYFVGEPDARKVSRLFGEYRKRQAEHKKTHGTEEEIEEYKLDFILGKTDTLVKPTTTTPSPTAKPTASSVMPTTTSPESGASPKSGTPKTRSRKR